MAPHQPKHGGNTLSRRDLGSPAPTFLQQLEPSGRQCSPAVALNPPAVENDNYPGSFSSCCPSCQPAVNAHVADRQRSAGLDRRRDMAAVAQIQPSASNVQRMAVSLRMFNMADGGPAVDSSSAPSQDVQAALVRCAGDILALGGVGQAGDLLSLVRGPDGRVWAWLQRQFGMPPLQQQPQQPQQQNQELPTVEQAYGCRGTLTGKVSVRRGRITLPREEACDFWRHTLSGEAPQGATVTLYVAVGLEGADGGNAPGVAQQGTPQKQQKPQEQQGVLFPFTPCLTCFNKHGQRSACQLWKMTIVRAMLTALGALEGDRVLFTRLPDGRVAVRVRDRAQEQQHHYHQQVGQGDGKLPLRRPSEGGAQRKAKGAKAAEGPAQRPCPVDSPQAPAPLEAARQSQQQHHHHHHHHHQHHQQQQLQVQRPPAEQNARAGGTAAPLPSAPGSLAGGMLVGYALANRVGLRQAAVAALFPAALSLSSGQTLEVEVHAAPLGGLGAAGQQQQQQHQEEPLAPYLLCLKVNQRERRRDWRMNGCAPLFRALSVSNYDAVVMWRSPGDGRLVVGMQRRSRGEEEEEEETSEDDGDVDVELDDGGEEEGGQGGEGEGEGEGAEEEEGKEEGEEGVRLSGGDCGLGVEWAVRRGPGAVLGSSGGWRGGPGEAGADGEGRGGDERSVSDSEGEDEEEDLDEGVNCWLRAVGGEGGAGEQGGVEEQGEEGEGEIMTG